MNHNAHAKLKLLHHAQQKEILADALLSFKSKSAMPGIWNRNTKDKSGSNLLN